MTGPAPTPGGDSAPSSSFLAELRSSERAGEVQPQAPARRRRIPLHLLVAGCVVTVGCGSLMAMRQIGMQAGMTFQTDGSLIPVDSPSGKDTQRLAIVLAELEQSQSPDAFAHERPEKNPFSLVASAPKKIEETHDEAAEQAQKQAEARAKRQEQVETALANLRLNGIVGGRGKYIASIGDKTFRIGDLVDDVFTITEIDGRTVTVAVDDQLYELTVGQVAPKPVSKKGAAKKPAK